MRIIKVRSTETETTTIPVHISHDTETEPFVDPDNFDLGESVPADIDAIEATLLESHSGRPRMDDEAITGYAPRAVTHPNRAPTVYTARGKMLGRAAVISASVALAAAAAFADGTENNNKADYQESINKRAAER